MYNNNNYWENYNSWNESKIVTGMDNVPQNLKETSINDVLNGETPITFKV